MNDVKVIVDPGSCHYNDGYLAYKLILAASMAGADAIKFQLFKDLPPNIALDYSKFQELVSWANKLKIEIFASVWDEEGLRLLDDTGCKSVKFAYSQNDSPLIKEALKLDFENVYISYPLNADPMDDHRVKSLYCIPEYPVYRTIDFDDTFDKFNGFSDHTLGIDQSITAVRHGAKIIEIHFQIGMNPTHELCPDTKFAIMPNRLYTLVETIKALPEETIKHSDSANHSFTVDRSSDPNNFLNVKF